MPSADLDRVQRAQDRLLATLEGHPDVNGVGIGRDAAGYVLKVNLREGSGRDAVPAEVDGVAVHVRVVGQVRKRPTA